MMLMIFGLSVNLSFSQTLWVKNHSGVTLDIGGDFKLLVDPPCGSPTDLSNFIALSVASGDGVGFPIPALRETFRLGGSESGGGMSGSNEITCITGEPEVCIEMGDFTLEWHDCNSVTIWP